MYGSPPLPPSKDLNLPHQPTGGYGGGRAGEAESDLLRRCHQQQQQMSSSLLRYRSAPSTLLGEVCEDFVPGRASGLETDTILARFLAPDLRDEPPGGVAATVGHSSPSFPPPPQSTSAQDSSEPQQNRVYSSAPQMVFCPQQQMPSHSSAESPFRASIGSSSMETEQIKNGDFGSSCGLIRHSSSPAGLFSHLNVENGYGMLRGMGGFRNGSGFMVDAASRSKGQQINFSSRQNSIMSQISETESEDVDVSSPKDGSGGGSRAYIPGFPVASWEDSPPFGSSFSGGLKRSREEKMVAGLGSLDPQDGEMKNHAPGFPHQFSLPKTSPELATMEKLLHFHDAVPCKIRAKRGCATHPRSIAERVRRTRISERMKKLQELVPNMDKQTNTADMLDLAVDYIKDLQKQAKALSESRASCTCSANRQKQF